MQITSTTIPEIEQLQRAGAGTRPRYSADEVARRMVGRTISFTDLAGNQQSYTIEQGNEVTVRELVVYPILRSEQPGVMEFHLAWDVLIGRGSNGIGVVHVDAVTDEILAATPLLQS